MLIIKNFLKTSERYLFGKQIDHLHVCCGLIRICAEKCLITCLVPVTLEDDEVVQRLLLLFSALDDHAKKWDMSF